MYLHPTHHTPIPPYPHVAVCQGANCGTGVQGHMMAVEYQQATIERWVAAIAAVGKTNSTLFQNCGVGCSPSSGNLGPGTGAQPWGACVNHEFKIVCDL